MKPSRLLIENGDAVRTIFSHYPMFSNIRVTGSIDRREDTDLCDIDFYVDANEDATLLDIAKLQAELEDFLLIDVDIISSRREYIMHFSENLSQFKVVDI